MSQDTRLRHKIMIGFTWEPGYELISVRNDLVTFCVQEPFRKQSVQKDTDRQSEVQSRIHVSTSKTATRQTVSVQTLHQAVIQVSTQCNLPLQTAIIECVRGRDMRLSLRELHEESQENEGLILTTWEFSNRRLLTQSASFGRRGILHPPPTSVIQVHCGRQLWYLFQCRVKKHDKLIHAYHDWDSDFVNDPKQWKAEVVVLEPSNVLGQHFYTTTTLSKTVSGRVDTYIHGVKIERVLYFQLRDLLFQLILYLEDGLNTDSIENDLSKFKVNTAEGLLDIVALSNLLLSLPALDIVTIFDARKPDAYWPLSEGRRAYFDIIYCLQEQYSLILFPDTPLAHDAFTKPLDSLVSPRIADFAKTSAIYFAWSLILSARKAQGWWKVYLKAFKQPTFFIWPRARPLDATVDEWAVMVVKERVAEVMQSLD
ncbi:uncharacterized protein EV420DRAFT_1483841 [Desarmillaria tabescens]|uniref:Uncharacterized protein n=1 Tax=Armillaria tabescens TaxID=1929756 RepID=A0AA39JRP8_ARMTA|nr:uncharacterized protein EV420DRAFT_1483841 [Desarmillaria tabescens]KAK0447494.1 hypothetical protein EV420DRAFT_1483841 [Desarmillaria tabescens]